MKIWHIPKLGEKTVFSNLFILEATFGSKVHLCSYLIEKVQEFTVTELY